MYADDVCNKKPDSDKTKENNFIIFSDSLSSLQALNAFKLELYIVQGIIKDYSILTSKKKIIALCWIPGLVLIPGDDKAESSAKSAFFLSITNLKFEQLSLSLKQLEFY